VPADALRRFLTLGGARTMGIQFLVFLALVAILILLMGVRLALLSREDRKRLSRAVGLLRRGMLPSKLEETLVAEGIDRATAADVVARALKGLTPASVAAPRLAPPQSATASASLDNLKTALPDTAKTAFEPLPATPHERACALLYKRRDYQGAIEAFTEAIELDPLFPNAYLGRAVAHRRLENIPAALQDERKAEELGGAEKSAWDRLVNRSRHRWHWDFDNPEWQRIDPLSRKAVLLRTLMVQIWNGGLHQWIANGYGRWIDDLIAAAREVDTGAAREVAAMLEDISVGISPEGLDHGWSEDDEVPEEDHVHEEEQDELLERILEHEERYHRVESQFGDDVEKWLEEKSAARSVEPNG
jgi:tetratricopeptide (TPR) repeat protein